MSDNIALLVGGIRVENFENYTIEADLYTADDAFSLELSNPETEITAGSRCELLVNGSVELVGIIDRVKKSYSKQGTILRVEGRDLMKKTADVIVTDGFTGNVALKALEGGMKTLFAALLEAFASEPHYKEHADALLPAILPLYAQMTPDTYGGAVLLGVDGICIISHGSSGETAILNAMKLAHELAEAGLVAEITAAFATEA